MTLDGDGARRIRRRSAPRDVIVAIKSASVGWVDLLMTSGQYQHMPKPPYCPGLEYAGVVAWAGPEVSAASRVGDAVLVDGFLAGPRSLGAYQAYGGFASYAVAPGGGGARRSPAGSRFDQACNLLGNYETAYHCLVTRGRLQAGETVLVHGASGSTGLAAVHVAKLLGATVIATGRSDGEARRREGAGRRPRDPQARAARRALPRRGEGAHRRRAASTWSTTASAATSRSRACAACASARASSSSAGPRRPFVARGQGPARRAQREPCCRPTSS